MKRALLMFFGVSLLAVLAGCASHQAASNACGDPACPPAGCQHQGLCPAHGAACGGRCGLGHGGQPAYNPGPPIGQVAYPYYTTRSPRDFLQRVPTPIGP